VKQPMLDSAETKAILRRMAEVRCDLDEGAQEIAESARDLGDWQHYVKSYPWLSLGAACLIGYMMVPRRRVEVPAFNDSLPESIDQDRPLPDTRPSWTSGIRNAARTQVGNLLWRSALSLAEQQLNQYFAGWSDAPTPEHSKDKT